MKKFLFMLMAVVILASLAACSSSPKNNSENSTGLDANDTPSNENSEISAADGVYVDTVLVEPDSDADFDTFEMAVTYTVENSRLVSIDFSSEDWGRPALKKDAANARYCNKAIVTICTDLINGRNAAEIDAVSGATCTSVSFKDSLERVEENGGIDWKSVSPDLVFTIDGAELTEEEVQKLLDADLDAEETEETEEHEGNGGKGNKGGKGASLELPDGCGITAEYSGRNSENWLMFDLIPNLPEGYTVEGINIIRVGNTAYSFSKDPEACAVLFGFDADNLVLTVNADSEYMTSTTLTVSVNVVQGEESGGVEVALDIADK